MKSFSVMLSTLAIGAFSTMSIMSNAATTEAAIMLPDVSPAHSDLANRGAYIARAADCAACHNENFAGGSPIATPMGDIYSTNITPSKRYGIGNYTKTDLKNVLHKGRSPKGMLYPAMPYPSYSGMTDSDIDALFAYLQTVPVVDEAPDYKTKLPFPFNFRILMVGWNAINIPSTEPRSGLTKTQQRGEYLVNNLEHCGTCHTPRNSTMGFDKQKYLSGAPLGNWHAPNITPDKSSGIGSWSEQDIVTYLRTGELDQRAYAAGPMGEAVAHSTRYLTDEDLGSIASYLKAVPAIQTDDKVNDVDVMRFLKPINTSITHDLIAQKDKLAQAKSRVSNDKNSPQALYLSACGSCHGVNGYGQPDARYAPIVGLSSLRRDKPDALVNVILYGIDGATNTSPKMPGFSQDLNAEQIAGIANYVRVSFGGLKDSKVDANDVNRIMTAKPEQPLLIKYAGILAGLGIIVALLIVALLLRWLFRRMSRAH